MHLIQGAERTDFQRFRKTETAAVISTDFTRPGADVGNQSRMGKETVLTRNVARDGAVIQPGFIGSGKKLYLNARGVAYAFQKNIGIFSFANRAGGNCLAAGYVIFSHFFPEIAQHIAENLNGFIADFPVAEHIGTERNRFFQFFQRSELTSGPVDFGNQHTRGMRTYVNRRHRNDGRFGGVLLNSGIFIVFFLACGHGKSPGGFLSCQNRGAYGNGVIAISGKSQLNSVHRQPEDMRFETLAEHRHDILSH